MRLRPIAASFVLSLAAFSVAVLPAQGASAATETVTTCAGSGPGSLPAVVAAAASGDTVAFSVTCPPTSPIVLNNTIDITQDLIIDGPGASSLAVSGNSAVEAFDVPSGVSATILGITIEDCGGFTYTDPPGTPTATVYEGGGILNDGTLNLADSNLSRNDANTGGDLYNGPDGTLHLTGSFLSGSEAAGGGGGIGNSGIATINDSTVSGDAAVGDAGGIWNTGTMTITNSTLSNNFNEYGPDSVSNSGGTMAISGSTIWQSGSIENVSGTVTLAATIVADGTSRSDCSGPITDAGFNLDDDGSCGFSGTSLSDTQARLDQNGVQNNGGPTPTIALVSGSTAIAAVNSASLCSAADQRQVPRPTPCDMGAVQLVIPRGITSAERFTTTVGRPFSFKVTTTGTPLPRIAKTGKLPEHVTFVRNGHGTATISGTPTRTKAFYLTITATFGTGTTKYVVTQLFTLRVNPG